MENLKNTNSLFPININTVNITNPSNNFNFKFDFDEDLLNPSKTFMKEDEFLMTKKKTAKDFFSSSSDEESLDSHISKSKKHKITKSNSISEFTSEDEKKTKIMEIFSKKKKSENSKIEKYKIKNKFLYNDYKKLENNSSENFKIAEIKDYSAEAIIKKFNKLKKNKKKKFLQKFETKNFRFENSEISLTLDYDKDSDIFKYGSLQMKDVPQFYRISFTKIIGLKNDKVSREILKDLNEMTGQYDKDKDQELSNLTANKKKLRYFDKKYFKYFVENNSSNNSINKSYFEKFNYSNNNISKKVKISKILRTEKMNYFFEDWKLLENINFEILFEKYFNNSFNPQNFFLQNNYEKTNISDNIFFQPQNFLTSIEKNANSGNSSDPLSLEIDFSQITSNEKNFLLQNTEFNKKLHDNPENIILWIDYLTYQDELFISNPNMFKTEKSKLETKLNILEKALKYEPNKKNYILNILRLRILNKIHSDNFDQINLYWIISFENFYEKKEFLNEYLLNLKKQPKLTINDIKDNLLALIKFYEIKLCKFSSIPTTENNLSLINKITKFIIDIIFEVLILEKNSGYLEKSFSILRAFLEVKILEYKNIIKFNSTTNTYNYKEYEEYFESNSPKVGDFNDSKGFLDYKVKKFHVKEDFIENNFFLTKKKKNGKNFYLNYRPLNSAYDTGDLELSPEEYIFYSDIKDFVETKIKINSELMVYIVSKAISYFIGFEIDSEICFSCKKNFLFDFQENNKKNLEKKIYFSKYYLIENKKINLKKNFQLLIYFSRFFKYFEDMSIKKKEIQILEMDFIFLVNFHKKKFLEKFLNDIDKTNTQKTSYENTFPFVDIISYSKNIFKIKENQNNINLWINYYNWLMIYEKYTDAEKIIKLINTMNNPEIKFDEFLKIKFTVINHYIYSLASLNGDLKYNKKELINLIFENLEFICDYKNLEPKKNEKILNFNFVDFKVEDFYLNFNRNYMMLISSYEKAEKNLQKYIWVNKEDDVNLDKYNIFTEFNFENVLYYVFFLFLADFSIKILKLQSENFVKEINTSHGKKNILIKSFLIHFKKLKIIEKNFCYFKNKKINCEHFLTQEFSRLFYKIIFLFKKNSTSFSNKNNLSDNNTEQTPNNLILQKFSIGENYENLLNINITPILNIKFLKFLNFSLGNKNDYFIYILCIFLNQFENPIDRELSFLNHFQENLNLKHAYYFLNCRYNSKINLFKKNISFENSFINQFRENTNFSEDTELKVNILQVLYIFKDYWIKAENNTSKIKKNFDIFLEQEKKNLGENIFEKENTSFLINQPIEPEIFNSYWKLILDLFYYFLISSKELDENLILKFSEYTLFVNHEYSLNLSSYKRAIGKFQNLILLTDQFLNKEKCFGKLLAEEEGIEIKVCRLEKIKENLQNNIRNMYDLIKLRELKFDD